MEKGRNIMSTPYDDVFRTLLEKCSKLIVPVINEVFHTDYSMQEKIELLSNEHYITELEKDPANGDSEKRITDSCVLIRNNLYHIECQSRKDYTMEIRMIEYDFHVALSHREEIDGIQTMRFPESAVLYLRHDTKTPDTMQVRLILPNQREAMYDMPIVKVQNYSKEDIFDKQLLFFIPYYILKFEKKLDEINENKEELKQLTEEYQDIYDRLCNLEGIKEIDGTYLHHLVNLTDKLINVVADKEENVKREVIKMGGKVLELEGEIIYKNGLEQAQANSILKYMDKSGASFEEACDFFDIPDKEYDLYRDKIEGLREQNPIEQVYRGKQR
jgi:hypothetical protein